MGLIQRVGKHIVNKLYDMRSIEYRFARGFIDEKRSILDIGCGTGTFLEYYKGNERAIGVDLNPENVTYCKERNLNAQVGDALNLQFKENTFDVVHASHLLHVFHSSQAVQFIKESGRVLKPGGLLIISTHNIFPRFYRHPENARPYPPDALYRLLGILGNRGGATSPMYPGLPVMKKRGLWLRRPPLIDCDSSTSASMGRVFSVLNALQYGLFLRKYWSYNSYIIVLEKI